MSKPYEILDAIVTKLLSHDADYITAVGTTDGWRWRKWKSGRTEAWKTYQGTAAACSSWGNIYYRDISVAIGSGIFSGYPSCAVTSFGNQHWVVSASANSSTNINIRLGAVNSASEYKPFLNLYLWEY